MKRYGGVSKIPCKVNGLPLEFIFDTGASDVSISMAEATFMLKNGWLSYDDIGEKSNYLDAVGNLNVGITINLKEIEIAGLKLYNVKASIVTNNEAPLLLGQSAISKLGTIQLNLAANTLTILNGKGSYDFSNNSQQNQPTIIKSQSSIIGNPKSVGNLEVAQYDFPKELSWDDAKKACSSLGNGWRLPTKFELISLYENKDIVGGFSNGNYWSSTEINNSNACLIHLNYGISGIFFKDFKLYVRAVRAF